MLHSKKRNCIILLLCSLFVVFSLFPHSPLVANAMSYSWYPPTCELSISDVPGVTVTSKSTTVEYSAERKRLVSTYRLTNDGEPSMVTCILPYFTQYSEVKQADAVLSLNDTPVTAVYGFSSLHSTLFGVESYSDIMDSFYDEEYPLDFKAECHEFVITTKVNSSFSFSLDESDHLLYDFNRHTYTAASRQFDVTVYPSVPAHFIVFGEKPTVSAEPECSVEYEKRTVKDLYHQWLEFSKLDAPNSDSAPILYARLSEFLASSYMLTESELLNSCFGNGYAFLIYYVTLPTGTSTISVSQPMTFGINSQLKPTVYVGKILAPAQSAPLSFSVTTNQFVVDSTLALNNNSYSGDAVEAVTIAFCTVKAPTLVNSPTVAWEPWRIAVVSLCGVLGIAAIVFLIVALIKWKRAK